jgi:predicted AlkP superfamily phosphohydrolase/phosphomutase
MKYLLIGIDGCQAETIFRYPMPFTQRLISDSVSLELEEDLLSRGWVEICTGQHAIDNDGYYERPLMDGSTAWTTSYNLLEKCRGDNAIPTLWQSLNSLGLRVGIMNVPTTNPAPAVDGFFVSGGGGGRSVRGEIEPSQCFPVEIKSYLDGMGYIVDERVPSLLFEKKLYDEQAFFAQLKRMTERRVEAFIELSKEHRVDFGFIVFRSVVVVENIAIGEYEKYRTGRGKVNLRLIEAMKDFYAHLDQSLRRLIEATGAGKIALVSDHGTEVVQTRVNLNVPLQKLGFQQKPDGKPALAAMARRYKHWLPYGLRQWLKGHKSVAREYSSISTFNRATSEAFTAGRGPSFFGIYINDVDRFGGPVPSDKIEIVSARVAEALNADTSFRELGMSAQVVYKKTDAPYSRHMPDVRIDAPSGLMCNNQQAQFAVPGVSLDQPLVLRELVGDFATGTKGAVPLACFINHDSLDPSGMQALDLTEIYRIVLAELRPDDFVTGQKLP